MYKSKPHSECSAQKHGDLPMCCKTEFLYVTCKTDFRISSTARDPYSKKSGVVVGIYSCYACPTTMIEELGWQSLAEQEQKQSIDDVQGSEQPDRNTAKSISTLFWSFLEKASAVNPGALQNRVLQIFICPNTCYSESRMNFLLMSRKVHH